MNLEGFDLTLTVYHRRNGLNLVVHDSSFSSQFIITEEYGQLVSLAVHGLSNSHGVLVNLVVVAHDLGLCKIRTSALSLCAKSAPRP